MNFLSIQSVASLASWSSWVRSKWAGASNSGAKNVSFQPPQDSAQIPQDSPPRNFSSNISSRAQRFLNSVLMPVDKLKLGAQQFWSFLQRRLGQPFTQLINFRPASGAGSPVPCSYNISKPIANAATTGDGSSEPAGSTIPVAGSTELAPKAQNYLSATDVSVNAPVAHIRYQYHYLSTLQQFSQVIANQKSLEDDQINLILLNIEALGTKYIELSAQPETPQVSELKDTVLITFKQTLASLFPDNAKLQVFFWRQTLSYKIALYKKLLAFANTLYKQNALDPAEWVLADLKRFESTLIQEKNPVLKQLQQSIFSVNEQLSTQLEAALTASDARPQFDALQDTLIQALQIYDTALHTKQAAGGKTTLDAAIETLDRTIHDALETTCDLRQAYSGLSLSTEIERLLTVQEKPSLSDELTAKKTALLHVLQTHTQAYLPQVIRQTLSTYLKQWPELKRDFEVHLQAEASAPQHLENLRAVLTFCARTLSILSRLRDLINNSGHPQLIGSCGIYLKEISKHLTVLTAYMDAVQKIIAKLTPDRSKSLFPATYLESLKSRATHNSDETHHQPADSANAAVASLLKLEQNIQEIKHSLHVNLEIIAKHQPPKELRPQLQKHMDEPEKLRSANALFSITE